VTKQEKQLQKSERDDRICKLYGLLHNQDKLAKATKFQFQKLAIRDTARNFSDLNEENIRSILRRKFDTEKHLKRQGGTT
jgi:hypothetical protein